MTTLMTQFGVSLTTGHTEKYESFTTRKGKTYIQYDYRHQDGELFSCVKPTLQLCRYLRDEWVAKKPLIEANKIDMYEAIDLFEAGEPILIVEEGSILNRKSVNYREKVANFFHMPAEDVFLNEVIRNLLDYRKYSLYKI